ncbi:MAG: hypothetical protein WA211_10080 [Candidatus Acidiferrales bacterium]
MQLENALRFFNKPRRRPGLQGDLDQVLDAICASNLTADEIERLFFNAGLPLPNPTLQMLLARRGPTTGGQSPEQRGEAIRQSHKAPDRTKFEARNMGTATGAGHEFVGVKV